MKPILDALYENLRHIKVVFEPTPDSFKKDTKQTCDVRELTVQELVKSYFPQTYMVKKGPIYSLDGVSSEIDCVLLAPNHPPLVTPKREVILAEGVHAAIEVKPDISVLTEKSEFNRGLNQIKSVKNLSRRINVFSDIILGKQIHADFQKIPCLIFSAKSSSAENVINFMKNSVEAGKFLSNQLPDVVISLDKGLIFHTTISNSCIFKNLILKVNSTPPEEAYIHFYHEDQHLILALFLFILYSFYPPEPHMVKPFIINYLDISEVLYQVYF